MGIFMSFKMAVSSIVSNKARSFLTMLGIIIGVMAVIIMVNLVNASMMGMKEWMDKMGTNIIEVSIYRDGSTTRNVGPEQMEQLARENPDVIQYISPTVSGSKMIKNGNRNYNGRVNGVGNHYAEINKRNMSYGEFFSSSEVANRASVAIIGEYTRQKLFGNRDPVGQQIRIDGEVFTVMGVFEQTESELAEWGDDAGVWIPYTRAMRLFKSNIVNEYTVTSVDENNSKNAEKLIKDYLYKIFRTEDYWIYNQAENLQEMNQEINGLTLLAAAIAGISLLVGGIGIMNIMLVTVTERTREIGIRKAVGARTRTILTQFLIESASISCMGGMVGIGIGIVGSEFATMAMQLPSVPMLDQLPIILFSFGFSALVGVFFGFYPAFKAARLNPIEALRYE